jgi:hypothetical protein
VQAGRPKLHQANVTGPRLAASGEQEHGSQTREQGGPFQVANVIASCWPGHAPDVSGRAVAHSATVP